jgi:hypothetical protein
VVAACRDARDLLISGYCGANPAWLGSLAQSGAVDAEAAGSAASWRCEYRNLSSQTSLALQAGVFCIKR